MRTSPSVALLLLALGACASTPEAPPAAPALDALPPGAEQATPATVVLEAAAAATPDAAATPAEAAVKPPDAAVTKPSACAGPNGAVNPPRPREGAGCPPMTQLLSLTPIVVLRHPTDRPPQLPADGLSLAIDGALLPGRFAVGELVQLCVPGGPRTVTFCAAEAPLAELVLEPPAEKKVLVGKGSLGPPPGLPPGFGPKGVPGGPVPTGVPAPAK